ncbi:MAG: metal ABC transporter substrate-binding protein [Thermoleophilaceae bacterium]
MGMILICFLTLLALATGCGRDSGDADVQVVATTTIAADIARHVTGPDAEVEALLPETAGPHDYAPSAKDRALLEEADVVVAWGAGLEQGLPLDDLDKDPVELAEGQENPHIWMDPELVALSLPKLSRALADTDPAHTDAYRDRAAQYVDELARLDRQVRRTLRAIPSERRKLVSSHDSLGHFVRRYDFEFVGAPFGLAPESEASAEKVVDLIERVEREDVPAVFAEDTDDPELMREIAREAGVEVVDDLLTEGFGDRVDGYEEMLRYDAERIAGALAP